jgi:hypothetical protein
MSWEEHKLLLNERLLMLFILIPHFFVHSAIPIYGLMH